MSSLTAIIQFEPKPYAAARAFTLMEACKTPWDRTSEALVVQSSWQTEIRPPSPQEIGEDAGILLGGNSRPVCSDDGTRWILFDGEIYNASELQQMLGSSCPPGACDSKLLLAAYDAWGTRCFERLNGAWVMLVLDLRRRRLIGSRDRLGIKSLFYSHENGRLVLAGQAKTTAAGRMQGPEIDFDHFHEFLRGLPPRSLARTFYRDVRVVPAGSIFEIGIEDPHPVPHFRSFWELESDVTRSQSASSFAEAQEQFLIHLGSSVKLRTGIGEHVGCFLSGGLDSSLISRLFVEQSNQLPRSAYSIVFDDPAMTELPYIEAVIKQGGLRLVTMTLTQELLWDTVDQAVRVHGEPLLGLDILAQFHALRLAAINHCSAVLDGGGADELLGGSPTSEFALIRDRMGSLEIARLASELRALGKTLPWKSVLNRHLLSPIRRQIKLKQGWEHYDWLNQSGLQASSPSTVRSQGFSHFQQAVRLQLREQNLPSILLHSDLNAAAAGIRVRTPYLDHHLVDFCFHLPADSFATVGVKKRILREVGKGYLPPSLIGKNKQGMIRSGPWMQMLRQHEGALRDMHNSSSMTNLHLLNACKVKAFVDDYLAGKHDDGLAVWRLYTSWRWLESF
jgi:asparagine synthase (glutamine-hydrolysing)